VVRALPLRRELAGPAHAFLTFGFADSQYVSISVEAQREVGEAFSTWQGALRQFELIYVIGDERDLIGLRAVVWGAPVHLYPGRATAAQVREPFVTMLRRAQAIERRDLPAVAPERTEPAVRIRGPWVFSGAAVCYAPDGDAAATASSSQPPLPMNRFLSLLFGLGLLAAGPAIAQTTHTVTLGLSSFNPASLTIEQGDTVMWVNNSGFHNVNGTTASYPDNPEGFTSGAPAPDPWTYSFTFDIPGDYDYHCDVHGAPGVGMRGTITVESAQQNYELEATNLTSLTVPAGGSIQFQYAISNNTGSPVSGDLFFTASGGLQGVVQSGTVPANTTIGPFTFVQQVPGNTPPGTYNYTLRIGQFPGVTVDSVPFTVTVTAAPRGASPAGPAATAWAVTEAEPWAAVSGAPAPTLVARPNPARGTATLSFALTEAGPVRLAVYDALGREVALLVNQPLEAGQHEAVLDGRSLPAGVYVYRLVVGGQEQSGRLTLVE
jgi:plastocyanin